MSRSQDTPGKKDKEKKKAQKKKEKEEKRQDRKANNNKGKGLDDMLAYIDEYGNITDTPPDPLKKKKEINVEDIEIGVAKHVREVREVQRTGTVTFFNDAKGYGFIQDLKSQENVFVHVNQLAETVKERDKVTFETENGPKGLNAIKVKKLK